jgi:hypothetical protein
MQVSLDSVQITAQHSNLLAIRPCNSLISAVVFFDIEKAFDTAAPINYINLEFSTNLIKQIYKNLSSGFYNCNLHVLHFTAS